MNQKKKLSPGTARAALVIVLVAALLFGGAIPALADSALTFSDVSKDSWAYATIMKAVDLGLFRGTSTPADGVGTFSPDKAMTRAEFITVCVRAAGEEPTKYKGSEDGYKDSWYDGYYDAAEELGIIDYGSFTLDEMNAPMSRQEMAYALVNTLKYLGETPDRLLDTKRIPDMNSVTIAYQPYVLRAYSMGLICGVDSNGTFNPNGTLTRAQAATVLVRLMDKDSRQKVDFDAPVTEMPAAPAKWVEGEKHGIPKAGDIVVKADGTEVVLTETKIGNGRLVILGLGQGVDLWTGTTVTNVKTGKETTLSVGMSAGGLVNGSDNSKLSAIGSEVHSDTEWDSIFLLPEYSRPTGDGSYYGEVRNTFWVWVEGKSGFTEGYGSFKDPDHWSHPWN